jgi:hypothetical protein
MDKTVMLQRDQREEQEHEQTTVENKNAEEKGERRNDVLEVSIEVKRPARAKPGSVPSENSHVSGGTIRNLHDLPLPLVEPVLNDRL